MYLTIDLTVTLVLTIDAVILRDDCCLFSAREDPRLTPELQFSFQSVYICGGVRWLERETLR